MKYLIAHRLTKAQHTKEVTTSYGDEVFEGGNETAEKIADQMRKTFRRQSSLLGTFFKEDNTLGHLAQLINIYLSCDESPETFQQLSIDAVSHLESEMGKSTLTTGGIVLFARFEHEDERHILIALVNENTVPWFDSKMRLKENQSIDLEKLRHGVRINLETHSDPDESGVSIMHGGRSKEVDYFSDFVDFVPKEDLNKIASRLIEVLEDFISRDESISDAASAEIFGRVHSYVKDRYESGEKVTLSGIANAALPDSPESLLDHLSKEDSGIPGEFSAPNSAQTKPMLRFYENQDGLSISFDRSKWARNIRAELTEEGNVRSDRIIIIRNPPDKMWEKLRNKATEEERIEQIQQFENEEGERILN